MTGKPGASGGTREGAGRQPLASYKGNSYRGDTPIEKLWQFLEENCGAELANEAHLYFNEQKRAYEQKRRDAIEAERKARQ